MTFSRKNQIEAVLARLRGDSGQNYKSLSRWHPDYLLEIGSYPFEEEYTQFLTERIDRDKRALKDPNLVVSAVTVQDNLKDNLTQVITANQETFLVTKDSYTARRHPLVQYDLREMKIVERLS